MRMEKVQSSSVSPNTSTDYSSLEIFNTRQYPKYNFTVHTSLGWESFNPHGGEKDDGVSGYLSLNRYF